MCAAERPRKIRALIVDDEPLARSNLSVLLRQHQEIEIAGECRQAYAQNARLLFICGRDAAERIVGWDYGEPEAFQRMLDQFELLVAARHGEYNPPAEIRDRVHALDVPPDIGPISATEVRDRLRSGAPWEHLVPGEIVPLVREIYRV